MKRASILKFIDNNYIIYPINTLKGGGGKASSPYYKISNITTYNEIAKVLVEALEHSMTDAPRPLDVKATHKYYLKSIGVKTMSELHKGSLSISIFTKDGNYNITPTMNMGPRKGFQGATKDRIAIPLDSSIEELGEALREALDKSK